MNLDNGKGNGADRVCDRAARVRVGSGIEQRAGNPIDSRVQQLDDLSLALGLVDLHLDSQAVRRIGDDRVHLVQGGRSIDRQLARAEQVQIRTVYDQDLQTSNLFSASSTASLGAVMPCSARPISFSKTKRTPPWYFLSRSH